MRHLRLCLSITLAASPIAWGSSFSTSVPIYDRDTVTYYVSGGIDGYGSTEFMLDTGSAYVTIDEQTLAVLKKRNNAEYVKSISGIMADGRRRTVPIYRLSAITIGDNCEIRNVEAAVFPGGTRHILGLSALKETAPFTVSVEPPALALSNCTAFPSQVSYAD